MVFDQTDGQIHLGSRESAIFKLCDEITQCVKLCEILISRRTFTVYSVSGPVIQAVASKTE